MHAVVGSPTQRSFLKALGPGLLWAGAAVGVSHFVQSTRAGASFGLELFGLVIIANVFKYPAFSFGPRYAAATGTSLLEGYRRQGLWALVLYAILTLGTMFIIQAVVTVVTAAIGAALLGWSGFPAVVQLTVFLTIICGVLLFVGHYRWLDLVIKVVVPLLTLSTLAATALVLARVDWATIRLFPGAALFSDPASVLFMVALVGWMPSAFDISIWHSLWTLARRRETRYAATVNEALLDFNIGYLGTAILALCFVALGAGVMYNSGAQFPDSAAGFANQVITLYGETLGAWSKPLIGVSAFTVMFSTTLTVIDGFPRSLATLVSRFKEPELPDQVSEINRSVYWMALVVLGLGSIGIVGFLLRSMVAMVDLATVLSFLTAPFLAWLNHRVILAEEMPQEHRPGLAMIAYSWSGIIFSTAFALYFLWVRWGG
ncbi:MAG TPA: divalent metal cation transporter [Candidatus Binatia bacterium]|nr:divalent metal cation transporter [Candidatus Binatia bacterium]